MFALDSGGGAKPLPKKQSERTGQLVGDEQSADAGMNVQNSDERKHLRRAKMADGVKSALTSATTLHDTVARAEECGGIVTSSATEQISETLPTTYQHPPVSAPLIYVNVARRQSPAMLPSTSTN